MSTDMAFPVASAEIAVFVVNGSVASVVQNALVSISREAKELILVPVEYAPNEGRESAASRP